MKQYNKACVGLGSNLDNPAQQIIAAIRHLNLHDEIKVCKTSGVWCSKPMGPQDQPDFLNAVVQIKTSLSPDHLLNALQSIEKKQHRTKDRHWGPRTIDLDILTYEDIILDTAHLKIPHTGITERNFVLLPLQQIAPYTRIKGEGLQHWINNTDLSLISEIVD